MKGIAVAGSILVDILNEISSFPKSGELTKILSQSKATGGLVPNVAIDLKRLDDSLDVYAIGKVGEDDNGRYALEVLSSNGIDVNNVILDDSDGTSFTDVMSVKGGQRTFFTYPGVSSTFGLSDINIDSLDVKMLHLGYFLLLDKIDNGDGEKILKKCKQNRIMTSIDVVTENSDRYSLVKPCLKYVDNLIINEEEASKIAGIKYNGENIQQIAQSLKDLGVIDRVIIHMPNRSVCLSDRGYIEVDSINLPSGYIKGTTGAGDAFCAGALLGIYNGLSDSEILDYGRISAVGALSSQDAISGMQSLEKLKEIIREIKC